MATITTNIRFASNIEELKRNLKEGIDTLDVMKAAVDRTAASLGGDGLLAAANRTAAAIAQLGGVEKLTNDERERTSALIDRAIAKYQALGQTAPTALREISTALKGNKDSWSEFVEGFDLEKAIKSPAETAKAAIVSLTESLGPAAIAGAAFTASMVAGGVALFELASHAAEVGARLDDMSDKTGLSVPALSRMNNAAAVLGTNLETLAQAQFKFEQKLGEGGDKFEAALGKLGLTIQDVKSTNPDGWLELVANRLNGIEDPAEKAAAGVALFGKSFSEVAATLHDLPKAFELVEGITPWTQEQAAAAEQFEMRLRALEVRAKTTGEAFGRDLIPPLEKGLQLLGDWGPALAEYAAQQTGIPGKVHDAAIAWDYATAALRMFRGEAEKIPGALDGMEKALDKRDLKKPEDYVKQWRAEVAARGTLPMPSQADISEATRDLTEQLKEQTKARKDAEEAAKKQAAAEEKVYQATEKNIEGSEKEGEAAAKAIAASFGHQQVLRNMGVAMGDIALGQGKQFIGFMNLMPDTTDRARLHMALLTSEVETFVQTSRTWGEAGASMLEGLPQLIQQGFTGGGGLAGGAKAIGSKFGAEMSGQIWQSVADSSGSNFFDSAMGKMLGNAIPFVGSLVGPLLGKLFSLGGPSKTELEGRDIEGQFEKQFGSFSKMQEAIAKAYVATGKSAADANRDIQTMFAAEKQGGEATAAAIKTITDQMQLQQQAAQALPGLLSELAGGLNQITPLAGNLGAGDQASFDRLARLVDTTAETMRAAGKSEGEIFAAIQPSLDALSAAQEKWGFAASGTLNELLKYRQFEKDNQAIAASIDGVSQMLHALSSMGRLTQSSFDDLTATTQDFLEQAQAAGLSEEEAMRRAQPALQQEWELWQAGKLAVDAKTEATLRNAEAEGLVGETMKDVGQQTLDILKAIAKALGADLPEAAAAGAAGVKSALADAVPTPKLDLQLGKVSDGLDQVATDADQGLGNTLSEGLPTDAETGVRGILNALDKIPSDVDVNVHINQTGTFPSLPPSGGGEPEVPAMGLPASLAPSLSAPPSAFALSGGGAGLPALPAASRAAGGGGDTYSVAIHAVDAASFAELTRRNPQALIAPIRTAVRRNTYGSRTDLNAALSGR